MGETMRVFKILGILAAFVVLCSGCSGDEYDQATRDVTYSEHTSAKDREAAQYCDVYDFPIYDCFDACQCCYPPATDTYDDHDELDQCVWYCGGLLLKINDIESKSKADIDNYKECVVGCFSICEKEDKDVACYDECKQYLG